MKNFYSLSMLLFLCFLFSSNTILACPEICVDKEVYIDCENTAVQLDGTCSSGTISAIQWTTSNGNIIAGANTLTPTVDAEGTYTLTLQGNGCTVTATTLVSNNLDVLNFEGNLSYNQALSDIWGYTAPNGDEYALVGTSNGVSIVDVSDPANPVEVQFVDRQGLSSIWWDLKTCGEYAYFITEDSNPGGLHIIDLSNLPNAAPLSVTQLGIGLRNSHNIFIDENCIGYIFGASNENASNGTVIIDIAANPTDPPVLGIYNQEYVHDGFVQDNILYSAEIYAGQLAIIDVSNPANPVVLGTVTTPTNFAHQVWVTPDNTTAFVLDEVGNAVVAVYDVSNPSNITLLDAWNDGTGAIMHNAFWVDGGFLTVSHYTSGTTVLDVSVPNVVIPVGNYDTSLSSGGSFDGQWGNYPYFPSGTLVASDQEQGLFVFSTNYIPASHIEGTITDACTGSNIANAQIDIQGVSGEEVTTNVSGYYITGVKDCGTYNITISANGYTTETISFALNSDEIRNLSVALTPTGSNCCNADAGDLDIPAGASLSFCEGNDIGAFSNNYTSIFETNPGTGYEYAFIASNGNTIVDFNANGDFDFSTYPSGTYTIYGFSYATNNSPANAQTYLANQSTISSIENDINNGNICADIDNQQANNTPTTVTINTCLDLANCTGITDFNVSARILLEGLWDGTSMSTDLINDGIMPQSQPYNVAPYNYSGTESISSFPTDMIDWVLVGLRDANGNLLDKQAAILNANGNLENLSGGECVVFPNVNASGQYYISIHHRGHLSVMSSVAVSSGTFYDFTTAQNQAIGIQQQKINNGAWVLYGGDFDNSRVINNTDFNQWAQNSAAVQQYLDIDIDGNGVVNNMDFNIWTINRSKVGDTLFNNNMQ